MGVIDQYVGKLVQVMTCDGRLVLGYLDGYDQVTNVVLADARERIFSVEEGVKEVSLGLYIIRGDNVACIGEVDVETDQRIDYENIKAPPLGFIWEMQ